ncbi:hypothetical protein EVAR_87905_1 [Eumeta japonica]|uniref:Uncharacterized protein n=1 Tax=Eumeta variegata TaxID=151549 RepID=A0A4C1TSG5_EUMVA|nr:hypothetical protein EVAR_13378_1 [Eumeta japonica]GBP54832.1 hypothetical protein EVAR_87905_1 [Eumeta japonica]
MAVQTKWTAASYKEERFLQNNAKWLTGTRCNVNICCSNESKSRRKSDASAIIKEITKSPTRAYKIRKVITQNKEKNIQRLSTMEALSMFVEAESDDSEDTGAQYTTTIDECDISDDNEFD